MTVQNVLLVYMGMKITYYGIGLFDMKLNSFFGIEYVNMGCGIHDMRFYL